VWLAARGYEVTAVDQSVVALAKAPSTPAGPRCAGGSTAPVTCCLVRRGNPVTDVRAGDDQHAIPQAVLREEAGFEKGDSEGSERTSGHAAKIVADNLGAFMADEPPEHVSHLESLLQHDWSRLPRPPTGPLSHRGFK